MRLLTLAGILAAVTFPAIAQTHARGGTAETLRNGPTPVENAVVPFLNHQEARTASDRLLFDRRQQHTRYAVPKASAGNMPEIYGSVIYSDNAATKPPGIYKLPVAAGESFELVAEGPNAEYGGAMVGDSYYTAYTGGYSFMPIPTIAVWNASTWTQTSSTGVDNSCMATDVAYDASTGKVYGAFANSAGTAMQFGTIDYSMGLVSRISSTTDLWCAMAAAPDGTLYGIASEYTGTISKPSISGSSLYIINKATGAKTLIGSTGLIPDYRYNTSAIIDPRSGRMF